MLTDEDSTNRRSQSVRVVRKVVRITKGEVARYYRQPAKRRGFESAADFLTAATVAGTKTTGFTRVPADLELRREPVLCFNPEYANLLGDEVKSISASSGGPNQ